MKRNTIITLCGNQWPIWDIPGRQSSRWTHQNPSVNTSKISRNEEKKTRHDWCVNYWKTSKSKFLQNHQQRIHAWVTLKLPRLTHSFLERDIKIIMTTQSVDYESRWLSCNTFSKTVSVWFNVICDGALPFWMIRIIKPGQELLA